MNSESTGNNNNYIPDIEKYFKVEELQKLQDLFSEAHEIACIITYPNGEPITKPTGFSRFCFDFIRSTEKGRDKCRYSDSVIGKFNQDGPIVQKCLCAGLWDAGVSIMIGNVHVANWLIGQVRTKDISENEIAEFTKELGIDQEASLKAFREVPFMSEERFRKIADFLFIYVNHLSEKTNNQLQLEASKKQVDEINERLELAMEVTLDGPWDWNLKTNEIYFSDRWKAILGYLPNELPNDFSVWEKLTRPEDVKESWNLLDKHIAGELDRFEIELQMKHKDGHWVDILSRAFAIFNDEGEAVRVVGTHIDISEEKSIRGKIIENEKRFRELTKHLPSGVAVYKAIDDGNDFMFVDFNAAAKKITNSLKEDVVGKTLLQCFPNMNESPLFKALQQVHKDGKEIYIPPFYYEDNMRNGWRENSIYKLPNDEIVAIFRDVTELKDAQELLKKKNLKLEDAILTAEQNEQRFKALHNASFGGIVIHDKGKILECNFGLSKITGYSHDELIGMDGLNLIAEEKREFVMEKIMSQYEKPYEAIGLKKGNIKYPVRLEAKMIHYKGKKVRVVEFRDISERKKLEKERIRREQLLNETGRIAKIGGWELDIATMTYYYTKETKQIYGLSTDEAPPKGMEGFNFFQKEAIPIVKEAVQLAIEEGKSYDMEVPFVTKKGEKLWVRTIGIPEIVDGKTVRLYGTIQDLTERKEEEQRDARFSKAIEQSPNSIVLTDLNGAIEYVNPAFIQLSGYSLEEVLGKTTNFMQSGIHDSDFYEELWNTILAGKVWQGQFCNRKKNGELYWESANISPVHDKNGKIINFLAIKEDITRTKLLIEELEESRIKAEESDRLKSAFLANMSHEIRTPMNGILGFIDLIQIPDLSDKEKAEFVDIINQSAKRLLETINDIIDYSKIEAGDIPLKFEQFNISEAFAIQQSFFELEAKEKGNTLSLVGIENFVDNIVCTDRTKLNSVLSNLLKNAIKFTNNGKITFGFDIAGTELKAYVSDTGVGIPEDKLGKIFERFIQADLNFSRGHEGSGLGLAICRGYIEKLGGKIWVESELGKGSTFWFTIQLDENTSRENVTNNKQNKAHQNQIRNDNKGLILVAEDDENSFSFMNILLTKSGYKIIRANNGEEAVKLYFDNPQIQLILMDIKMPVKDGYQATREIREVDATIPIIAQTAFAQRKDIEKSLNAGCNNYIAKPIIKATLFELLNKYLKK